ncbi:MAG TPA: hypothetical protein PLD02_02550 [Saprospiraceae bacterium]|nr:hypothetical protein [Saprospiraceae bacterium]
MTIREIYTQLEHSVHPVAKSIHKGDHFNVLVIGFRSGMLLKEHQAKWPSRLTILEGKVKYVTNKGQIIMDQYDEMVIPLLEIHSVVALTDSLCLLTQG